MTGSPGLAVTLPRGVLTVPDKANTTAMSQWRIARRTEGGEETAPGSTGSSLTTPADRGERSVATPADRAERSVATPADRGERSVVTGNIADFRSLFEAHGEKMKSVAYQLLRNHSDAEDAVQEAFLKAYRGVENFRGHSAVSTWVYRILVNACHDMRRKRNRREDSLEEREENMPGTTGREVSGTRTSEPGSSPLRVELNGALEKLHPTMRTVFILFEVEGFRHREISKMLDIPEGTSKNLLFRAKRELQDILLSRRRAIHGGLL